MSYLWLEEGHPNDAPSIPRHPPTTDPGEEGPPVEEGLPAQAEAPEATGAVNAAGH